MTTVADSAKGKRLTPRGAKTRSRIVDAAADLMYVRGVGATSLEDVVAASGVSKSQLYHHFSGKDEVVRAVIDLMGERVILRERDTLGRVSTVARARSSCSRSRRRSVPGENSASIPAARSTTA